MSRIEIFDTIAFSKEVNASTQSQTETRKRKSSNRDELFDQLKLDLLRATYKPGERLIEERLAEKLGASRTPIREVLTRLASEGLIGTKGRSYIALEISIDTLKEVFDVRKALEDLAIQQAAEAKSDAGLERISQAMATMTESHARGDWLATNAADSMFHLRIAEMSGNDTLLLALCQIHERVLLIRNQYFAHKNLQTVALEEHDRIFDAVARGAGQVARAEMAHHIEGTINKFLSGLERPEADANGADPAAADHPAVNLSVSGERRL